MITPTFPTNVKFRPADNVSFSGSGPNAANMITDSGGGINIVALEAGQALSDHKAPGDVLIYVLEGLVVFNFPENDSIELGKGDAMLMTTGAIHNVKALAPTKFMLIKFTVN